MASPLTKKNALALTTRPLPIFLKVIGTEKNREKPRGNLSEGHREINRNT